MIPVGPGEIPTSGEELSSRVSTFLSEVITSGQMPVITGTMTSPDKIESFTLDVSGAEVGDAKLARPSGFTRLGNVVVSSLDIKGDPALVFGAPVLISTRASHLPMSWSRDDRGNLWLVPSESASGQTSPEGALELAAEITQIERAARATIATLAEQNGAKLKDFNLRIESAGPRALAARVDVAASKFMMTAKLIIIAEAMLDDEMNLRIGQLEIKGDGAAGGMVANMIADKVRGFQGRVIPLGQFMFAGAALKDVKLTTDDRLRLTANFG